MMKEYSIGFDELMSFPYTEYLEFAKIISLESKEEQRKQKDMENRMEQGRKSY